jgi:hypothetical protein
MKCNIQLLGWLDDLERGKTESHEDEERES